MTHPGHRSLCKGSPFFLHCHPLPRWFHNMVFFGDHWLVWLCSRCGSLNFDDEQHYIILVNLMRNAINLRMVAYISTQRRHARKSCGCTLVL